jgi:hypothetical protein
MSQPFRLDNEGLINRDKKIKLLPLMEVNILVMRVIH